MFHPHRLTRDSSLVQTKPSGMTDAALLSVACQRRAEHVRTAIVRALGWRAYGRGLVVVIGVVLVSVALSLLLWLWLRM